MLYKFSNLFLLYGKIDGQKCALSLKTQINVQLNVKFVHHVLLYITYI